MRFLRFASLMGAGLSSLLAWANACSTYDDSLLQGGGGSGTGAAGFGGEGLGGEGLGGEGLGGEGGGGAGGGVPCQAADQCPGEDTECGWRTCEGGVCGAAAAPAGTPLAQQTPHDCRTAQCDGDGAVEAIADDADTEDDGIECTADACSNGLPTHDPKPERAPCGGGASLCTIDAQCVECIDDDDCTSDVCDEEHSCAPASCGDFVKNGNETDVDCGGLVCPACSPGSDCIQNSDCVGGLCSGLVCAPTCTDGVTNGAETDVDCGGPSCPDCALGQDCLDPDDCQTGNCSGGTCECGGPHLVISEVRSRGIGGGNDDFVEIYNPTSAPVALDATWKVDARSSNAGSFGDRWTGGPNLQIPAHGHFLIAGIAYAGAIAANGTLTSGITDASAVRLVHNSVPVDTVCYFYDAQTLTTLSNPQNGYGCEGTPIDNSPHNDAGGAGNVDQSLEREPGAALGNCIDTNDTSADWNALAPSAPQNTASAPTP